MPNWFDRLSIRTQVLLLVLAIILPTAAMFTWFRLDDAHHAREDARAKVGVLGATAAANLERFLGQTEATLARLAARPHVRALDPQRCDPIVAEFVKINPEFTQLGTRDLEGNIVCSYLPNPIARINPQEFPWFEEGLRTGIFTAGNAFRGRQVGRWVSVLTQPIRDESGNTIALLALPVDLVKLSAQILSSVPKGTLVTITDRNGSVLLRSSEAEKYIGAQTPPRTELATRGMREGFLSAMGADGVVRLTKFITLPGVEWRVVAGIPETEVFADYDARLKRNLAIGLGVLLLALALGLRISNAIVRPISELADIAGKVAAGDSAVRAKLAGPAEVESVARQFNGMLDARDRSEATLRESEENLAITLQSIGDAVIATDARGGVTRMNPTAERLTGWTLAEAMGRPLGEVFRIINAETRVPAADPVAQVLVRGEVVGLANHTALLARDGKEYQISDSAAPIRDRAGDVTGVVLVFIDVTEQYRARQALHASEENYRRIVETAAEGIWRIDADSRTTFVNARMAQMLGYTVGEMIGAPMFEFMDETAHATAARNVERRRLGIEEQHDFKLRRKDGAEIWTQMNTSPLRDEAGNYAGALAMVVDVTERLRVRQALQESEERYRTLIEWSPEPIRVHRDETVIYVNPAAVRMFGATSAQDLVGKSMFDRIHPDSRERARARLKSTTDDAFVAPKIELCFTRLDGTEIDVEVDGTSILFDGRPAVLASLHDITGRKRAEAARAVLEAQLRESQKMEAIGTLAGGIAHDFNNIIGTVLGNTELARQDAGPNPRLVESLEEIRKAGHRARDLVRQILSFSRRQPTERKAIELGPVVAESVRLLRTTLPARVRIECKVAAAMAVVMADPTQIQQVLLNLGVNAAQAMAGRHGQIDFSVEPVTLDAEAARSISKEMKSGTYVRISVSDDGDGMDQATVARIFEPFFTTKPVGEGTGLGLAVVHGIVQAHDGALAVHSEPGKGSRFDVYLPAAYNTVTTAGGEPPAPALLDGHGQQVLYIDDDESLVLLVTRLLQRRGYRVSGHVDQNEALALLRADPSRFQLVVTDYNMPGMSGLDVARAVRALRPNLPVVVASGFITDELKAKAAEAGVINLIFKANAAEEFCAVVQRLVPGPAD